MKLAPYLLALAAALPALAHPADPLLLGLPPIQPREPAARPLQPRAARTTVVLPQATVVGKSDGGVDSFAGIPFAQPPVGALRLKPPQPLTQNLGTVSATGTAPACPQFFFSTTDSNLLFQVLAGLLTLPIFDAADIAQEDCLTVSVQRPAGTAPTAKLPVLVWIFGGGFELGSTSMYDAAGLVANGVAQGKPFVFVAINYRVGGFGFMPGKEILQDGSANLGLLDQRLGLQWVADNVAAFGGDPDKVTIWGESAGAISVLDQMALYGGNNTYKGKPLFRGAIMNSGSIAPTDPVDCPKGQAVYDQVVREAGCAAAADSLECLRAADYTTFLRAANSVPGLLSYSSVALSYVPRPDGTALPDSPDILVASGRYAAVPMIIGDQEDEGTIFALFQPNVTRSADVVDYLKSLFFHSASKAELGALVETYDARISQGSPFGTGIFNELYPGFKRLAAILGDLVFTLTRRTFLVDARRANPGVPAWSYLASYNFGTPFLGTFHGSDILQVFYGILPNYASRSIQSYYLNFVHNLDPNDATKAPGAAGTVASFPTWPQWTNAGRQMVRFWNDRSEIIKDDFRQDSWEWINANVHVLRL